DVLYEAERHADARTRKPDVPIDSLGEVSSDERPEQSPEVDPHVEEGETGIAAGVACVVQRAHERADVGLAKAGPDPDEGEAPVEEGKLLEDEREVAERDDDPADQHAAILTEPPVGNDAAENCGAPDGSGVGAVDRCRVPVRKAEAACRD